MPDSETVVMPQLDRLRRERGFIRAHRLRVAVSLAVVCAVAHTALSGASVWLPTSGPGDDVYVSAPSALVRLYAAFATTALLDALPLHHFLSPRGDERLRLGTYLLMTAIGILPAVLLTPVMGIDQASVAWRDTLFFVGLCMTLSVAVHRVFSTLAPFVHIMALLLWGQDPNGNTRQWAMLDLSDSTDAAYVYAVGMFVVGGLAAYLAPRLRWNGIAMDRW